jgi:hypothetical protein
MTKDDARIKFTKKNPYRGDDKHVFNTDGCWCAAAVGNNTTEDTMVATPRQERGYNND